MMPGTPGAPSRVIDNLSLGLTHGLMMLAALLLLRRPDLDHEDAERAPETRRGRWGRRDG